MAAPLRMSMLQASRYFHNGLLRVQVSARSLCQKGEPTKTTRPPKQEKKTPKVEKYDRKDSQYYKHNTFTYYDYEIKMEADRLPQPSSVK